jgi:serine protease Do
VTPDVADALGLEDANGALVSDVPDGPAKDGGVLAGDVIISFDGVDVSDTRQLVRVVANAPVGKTVRVVVNRNGETQTLKITLGRREEAQGAVPAAAPAEPEAPKQLELMGLTLSPLTDEIRTELQLSETARGLAVVGVEETSQAFEKGLRAGDIITEAGQSPVLELDDLQKRVEESKEGGRKSLLLLVRRGGDPRSVALSLDAEYVGRKM